MDTLTDKLPKSINWQKINQSLPVWINVLIILAISYTLAQLTWLLIPAETESYSPSVRTSTLQTKTQSDESQAQIEQLYQAHLFGKYEAIISKAVKTVAPDTRLNLELTGVLAADPMDNASAIISIGKRGNEDIYSIGDKVSGATVKEIYPDHIIIERSGRLETLRLPKEFSSNTLITKNSSTHSSEINASSTPGQVLGKIRQKIIKNPTSFGQYAIPVPYSENGKLRGYRLQPQRDRALFDQVGLEPTDVIIGINGVSLDNPTNGLKALQALQKARQINITVLRNGAEIPLSFEIP